MEALFNGVNQTSDSLYAWLNTTIGYSNGTDQFLYNLSNNSSGEKSLNQINSPQKAYLIFTKIICVLGMIGNPVAFLVWNKERGFKSYKKIGPLTI